MATYIHDPVLADFFLELVVEIDTDKNEEDDESQPGRHVMSRVPAEGRPGQSRIGQGSSYQERRPVRGKTKTAAIWM